jgi:hypothetical protein
MSFILLVFDYGGRVVLSGEPDRIHKALEVVGEAMKGGTVLVFDDLHDLAIFLQVFDAYLCGGIVGFVQVDTGHIVLVLVACEQAPLPSNYIFHVVHPVGGYSQRALCALRRLVGPHNVKHQFIRQL